VRPGEHLPLYQALYTAIGRELCASVHGIYRGGLAVHLALMAMGADLGLRVDLGKVPGEGALDDTTRLFSESAGRFLVTVAGDHRAAFEALLQGHRFACLGEVTAETNLVIHSQEGTELTAVSIAEMRNAWKTPFGQLL
jgi:phosphoribosylformylglycinamidine synthase